MIDPHCHILHALDDGPKKVKESIQLAQALSKAGYRMVVATPHMIPGTVWMPSIEDITRSDHTLESSHADCRLVSQNSSRHGDCFGSPNPQFIGFRLSAAPGRLQLPVDRTPLPAASRRNGITFCSRFWPRDTEFYWPILNDVPIWLPDRTW